MKYSILIWLIALIIGPILTPIIASAVGNISPADITGFWLDAWLLMFLFSLLLFLPSLLIMIWLVYRFQQKNTGTLSIKSALLLTNSIIAWLVFTVWPLIDRGSAMSYIFPLAYSIAFMLPVLMIPLPPAKAFPSKTPEKENDIF
jgi:hypothetical protein